ncbi:efflux RND transporter periplasmic adaptor subunit [Neotabrizicola sp. sgz301269]|uniref:efflux RND transporter periplasmic adaptor subunit n=1 Tax=Neotabrizicola sp. sgz301269 TaxID=3276282 RepID=UPI0037704141
MPETTSPSAANVKRPELAALGKIKTRRRGRRWLWLILIVAALVAGGWYYTNRPAAPVRYDTAMVEKGALTVTVVATGTVQPTTQVDISSELSGTLLSVDVDFNDEVTEGQVLAKLDDTKLKAQVSNAEAQLIAAQAKLASAEATVSETADALDSASALDKRGLSTRSVYISAKAAHDRALAAVESAQADVTLAEANLALQKADLEKADIRSPIKGIVLNRAAEKGQIVAATLNAPVLFTLAEDLARMDLQVSVDEADIGRVAVGQKATFTVDAYPGQKFEAVITSLRYAPDDTEGVVTYTAVLSVANDKLLLRPGMTATATITVAEQADVLLVPTAALRYAPPVTQNASRSGSGLLGYILPARPSSGGNRGASNGSGVYVLKDGAPMRVAVTPGATDGSKIAVSSEELSEGDEVILSQSAGG